MQSNNVLTSFRSFEYPSELILMMTKAIQKGVLIATLLAASLVTLLLYGFVPFYILTLWLIGQFALSVARVNIARKLEQSLQQETAAKKKYIKLTVFTTALSAVMWGLTSWLTILYAPDPYSYYVLIILAALTAGAATTLGSVFHAYFVFMSIILLMVSLSFAYYGGDMHLLIAFITLIAITILTATGSDHYFKLKKIVELSVELKNFNTALEERVQKEVAKNIEKDIQLIHQARLAQMGEMISLIAHQWRQPLNIISTAATDLDLKLQLGSIDDASCQKNVATINQLTQHLSATIDDFRDFFKVTKEKEVTSVDDVINKTLKIIKEYVENKNITIHTDLNSSGTFSSYPNELKQVVINLITNAEDALLDKNVNEAAIYIKTFSDSTHHCLEVCDNAGGIDNDVIGNIFDAYYSTKEAGKGTGLGLYMSKKIIEEHCGGTLEVKNRDKGACFYVRLPK